MPYRIDLRDAGAAALDRLVDLGALDIAPHGNGLVALMPDSVAPEQVADAAGVTRFSVSAAVGRDADSVWTLHPRPIQIRGVTIQLTDTPVFGTGMHPTTALCLEMLDGIVGHDPPARVLDVGTGSGVLAIAALKLGAGRVTAIDIDAAAVSAAAENARLNGVDDLIDVRHGGPDTLSGAWPLVVANVLAAPLIELVPLLVRRVAHHGQLVLSGIPSGVEDDVVRAYRRAGMRHRESRSRGGWAAVLMQATW